MTLPIGNQTVLAVVISYGPPDELGVPTETEAQTPISNCSFQPLVTIETLGDVDEVTSHWKLYAPATVNLRAVDAIVTPWDGLRYEVDGDPQTWTDMFGRISHQEVILRRATG